MWSEIIIGAIGLISSTITFLFGRRKTKAEVSLIESSNLDAIRQFYTDLQKDQSDILNYYIKITRENSEEIERLKSIINILMEDACVQRDCQVRLPYSFSERKELLFAQNHEDVEK